MEIIFGRYSDSFKPKDKVELWNQSEKLFEQKKYIEAYEAFFNYLRDEKLENVFFTPEDSTVKFRFYQGSKEINGVINTSKVTAETKIAAFDKPGVAFMRRIMEMNFNLYYSRFAITDNDIVIKFDSTVDSTPPRKLYYALKELSTRADKQDDVLLNDFPLLKPVEVFETDYSDDVKEYLYKHYQKWLTEVLKRVSELKEDTFSGGISYLLLNCIYKIDYLIAPQGEVQNELEMIHYGYFARDNKPFEEKNSAMGEQAKKLLEKPKEKVFHDLYKTKATFGISNPAPHTAVVDTINNNIGNVKWYVDNKYEDIAVLIFQYMAGYCLFYYGLPKPDVELFRLIMNITEQDYFIEAGYPEKYFDTANKKFDEELIKKRIDEIITNGKAEYPQLKLDTAGLKFDSVLSFLRSLYTEILKLDFNTD